MPSQKGVCIIKQLRDYEFGSCIDFGFEILNLSILISARFGVSIRIPYATFRTRFYGS